MTEEQRMLTKLALINWIDSGMESRYLIDQLGMGYFDIPRDVFVLVEETLDLLIETVSNL